MVQNDGAGVAEGLRRSLAKPSLNSCAWKLGKAGGWGDSAVWSWG